MANNRDVDLVIRARNEASKAVEAISTALETLVGKTEAVQESGKKTDTVLQSLKTRFGELGREAQGVQNLDKITAAFGRANNAVERMNKTVETNEAELADLRSRTQQLVTVEQELQSRANAGAAAIDKQKNSVRTLKTEATSTAAEIAKLERELQRLEATRVATTQQRSSVASLSTDRQGRSANLRNELPGSTARDSAQTILTAELATQKTRHTAILAQLAAEQEALGKEDAALKNLGATLRANQVEQRTLAGQIDNSTASLDKNIRSLKTAKDALEDIREASLTASDSLAKVSGRQGVVAQGALQVAGAQATAVGASTEAQREVQRQSQDQAVANARSALAAAQAELSASLASSTPQVTYIDRLKSASSEVKTEVLAAKESMKGFKEEVKSTASEIKTVQKELDKIERALARPKPKSKSEEVYNAEQADRVSRASVLREQLDGLKAQLAPQQELLDQEAARVAQSQAVADQMKAQTRAATDLAKAQERVGVTSRLVARLEGDMAKPRPARTSEGAFAEKQSERAEALAAFREQLRVEQNTLDAATLHHAAVATQAGAVAVNALSREAKAVQDLEAALEEATQKAARLASEMASIGTAQERGARSAARIGAEQAMIAARIEGLSQNRKGPVAATEINALNRQKLEANRAFAEQEAEVRTLARAFRDAEEPTEEMGRALGAAQAKARIAKQDYQALAEATQRLRTETARANVEQADAATIQERIAQTKARMAAEQATIQGRIDALSKKQAPLSVATEASPLNRQKLEARRAFADAENEVRTLARAMREAEAPTEAMGRALGEAQAKARLAKQEYQALAEAAHRLKVSTGGGQDGSFSNFIRRVDPRGPAAAQAPAAAAPPPIAPQEVRQTGQAMGEATKGANTFRDALKGIYGDTRESLSLMQRLRGEVLSLAASYVGLQAAMSGVRYVLDVFRMLEAAQSRLGAVFNQDTTRIGQEIDWLRRLANRLGVEFGSLADEYGKFAIASQAANVSAGDTRTIFTSVTEAGRVMKLSNDQLKGVFLALTQMMSKGKVQAQELRQQLGDRLSGAFAIFAQAIGVTTAELDKMMEQGEVIASSDTMLAFAREMQKRFGPQLAAALQTTTAEMGRFQNNLQAAALQVASGGLIDGFTSMLSELNRYFQSDEGREFFLSLGAGAKTFFNAITALIPYIGYLDTAFKLFLAYKLGSFFLTSALGLKTWGGAVKEATVMTDGLVGAQARLATFSTALSRELTLMQIGLNLNAAAMGRSAVAANVLSAGIAVFRTIATGAIAVARGLLAAFGGLGGIVATGLTFAAMAWFTAVDDTTDSIEKHKQIVDKIVTAYDAAKDKASDWADKIKDVSRSQLRAEIETAKETATSAMQAVRAPTMLGQSEFGDMTMVDQNAGLTALVQRFKAGKVTIAEFKREVDRIGDEDRTLSPKMLAGLIQSAEKADEARLMYEKLQAAEKLTSRNSEEAAAAYKKLNGELEDNALKKAVVDAKAFADAINELKSGIPQLVIEMKRLKDEKDALESLGKAVAAAGQTGDTAGDPDKLREAYSVYEGRRKAILDEETKSYIKQFGGDKIPLSLAKEIYGGEGYRSQAYKDSGGVPTIGFGSTNVNGKPVEMGDTITKADAVRQMVEDLSKFTAMVDSAVGNAKLTENQRNALTSYVYNVGNTSGSDATRAIFEAIRQGRPDAEVAKLLGEGGIATVNGQPNAALRDRRRREAGLYLTPDDRAAGQDSGATIADREKARQDARNQTAEEVRKQVERDNREAGNQKKINDAPDQTTAKREVAIQTAVFEARNRAIERGGELLKEEEEAIKRSTAAKYDQEHINDRAKESEEKVNALYRLRQQLLEELKVAQEHGDAGQIATTRNSINEVSKQLQDAIPVAIKFWESVGGVEADTAIAKLRLMAAQTQRNKTEIATAGQINEKFASGAVNAFDNIANGIGKAIAGTGSWKEAIQGIGQAFLQFAADFLREIANMILKQLILNALQQGMGGGGGGGFGAIVSSAINAMVGTGHTGGVVGSRWIGSGNATRMVDPSWFANAQRFHGGGLPGLAPGEVPAILRKNEEVLTQDDPRNVLNGAAKGGGNSGPSSIKSVLVMDPGMIPDAMAAGPGEQVVMSHIKSNVSTLRQLLGIG